MFLNDFKCFAVYNSHPRHKPFAMLFQSIEFITCFFEAIFAGRIICCICSIICSKVIPYFWLVIVIELYPVPQLRVGNQ